MGGESGEGPARGEFMDGAERDDRRERDDVAGRDAGVKREDAIDYHYVAESKESEWNV